MTCKKSQMQKNKKTWSSLVTITSSEWELCDGDQDGVDWQKINPFLTPAWTFSFGQLLSKVKFKKGGGGYQVTVVVTAVVCFMLVLWKEFKFNSGLFMNVMFSQKYWKWLNIHVGTVSQEV